MKNEEEKSTLLKSMQTAVEEIKRLEEEGQKDYDGMREFQRKFIEADHELRHAKKLLARAADALSLSHSTFDPECGICRLIQDLRNAAT